MLPKSQGPNWIQGLTRRHLSALYLFALTSFSVRFSLQSINSITQQIETSFSCSIVTENSQNLVSLTVWGYQSQTEFSFSPLPNPLCVMVLCLREVTNPDWPGLVTCAPLVNRLGPPGLRLRRIWIPKESRSDVSRKRRSNG